mmetsp:Transcript_122343/g.380901  ORF Transcript_122343/g.380901 Transcript_122343/m.380901 type:complete len:255 (-) Transcript_122343:68-832(-)
MAAASPLEQAAALVGTFGKALDVAMPEKRPPDPVTLAHKRAAEWLHEVASWLLHGGDLDVVCRRTPYTAESAKDLWRYYEGLPLDQRVDKIVAYFLALEMMRSLGIFSLSREQFPKLRRCVDVYSGVLVTACLMPRRVFYYLHLAIWNVESMLVKREIHGPVAPLPLSAEMEESITRTAEQWWSLLGGPAPAAARSSSGRGTPWVTVLLATSIGVGAVIWLAGTDRVRGARRTAVDKWLQIQRGLGSSPRFLLQ